MNQSSRGRMKANPDHFKKHSVSKLLHYGLGAFSFLVAAVAAPAAELVLNCVN